MKKAKKAIDVRGPITVTMISKATAEELDKLRDTLSKQYNAACWDDLESKVGPQSQRDLALDGDAVDDFIYGMLFMTPSALDADEYKITKKVLNGFPKDERKALNQRVEFDQARTRYIGAMTDYKRFAVACGLRLLELYEEAKVEKKRSPKKVVTKAKTNAVRKGRS